MPTFLETLFSTYLIYPLLGLLMVGLAAFIAKKNALLSNKKLIAYTLVAIILLVIPSLMGLLDYGFMPWGYIVLVIFYLIVGYYNTLWMPRIFGDKMKYRQEAILTCFLTLTAMMFFALVFNLCNELQYGILACSCLFPFLFVSVFRKTCHIFIEIPVPIYKIWHYGNTEDYSNDLADSTIDYGRLQVFAVEIYKQENDPLPIKVSIKAPEDIPFGNWFTRLISDYNAKSPLQPIDNFADEPDGGWVFHTRPGLFSTRRYIDCDITIRKNKIRSREVIVARRVKENII